MRVFLNVPYGLHADGTANNMASQDCKFLILLCMLGYVMLCVVVWCYVMLCYYIFQGLKVHSSSVDCISNNQTLWKGVRSAVLNLLLPPPILSQTGTCYMFLCHFAIKAQWSPVFQTKYMRVCLWRHELLVIKQTYKFAYLNVKFDLVLLCKII